MMASAGYALFPLELSVPASRPVATRDTISTSTAGIPACRSWKMKQLCCQNRRILRQVIAGRGDIETLQQALQLPRGSRLAMNRFSRRCAR